MISGTGLIGKGFRRGYDLYPAKGLEGMIDDSIPHDVITVSNNATTTSQVFKIAIGTPTPNTEYKLRFSSSKFDVDASIVYKSGDDATAVSIVNGLYTAVVSDLRVTAVLRPLIDSSSLLITSRTPGSAGQFVATTSGGGAGFTGTIQSPPADASVILFGRLLWQRQTDPGRNCRVVDGQPNQGVIRGFSVRTEVHEGFFPDMDPGYLPQDEMNCLTKGRIQIRAVGEMHPMSQIHYYIAGENQGRLTAKPDGNLTVQYMGTGIRMYESCNAYEIGRVEVNLP